ncbi:MAG: hypothetical protein V3T17_01500 [Pseudomonadales bacterium]
MPNTAITRETQLNIRQFFRAHSIKALTLGANTCINNRNTVTDVLVLCVSKQGDDYTVAFKLQTDCADICKFLLKIESGPEVRLTFTETALVLEAEEREALVNQFLKSIDIRVKETKKEQEIQSIKYLGNVFELNKKTVFKVISDDGDGHLGIELLGNPLSQALKLSSHGLLDGLYRGIIRQIEQ